MVVIATALTLILIRDGVYSIQNNVKIISSDISVSFTDKSDVHLRHYYITEIMLKVALHINNYNLHTLLFDDDGYDKKYMICLHGEYIVEIVLIL